MVEKDTARAKEVVDLESDSDEKRVEKTKSGESVSNNQSKSNSEQGSITKTKFYLSCRPCLYVCLPLFGYFLTGSLKNCMKSKDSCDRRKQLSS